MAGTDRQQKMLLHLSQKYNTADKHNIDNEKWQTHKKDVMNSRLVNHNVNVILMLLMVLLMEDKSRQFISDINDPFSWISNITLS